MLSMLIIAITDLITEKDKQKRNQHLTWLVTYLLFLGVCVLIGLSHTH